MENNRDIKNERKENVKRNFKSLKKFFNFKAIFILLIILSVSETYLYILEVNGEFDEPYLWGNRNEIPWKINECEKLFTKEKHKDKVKVVCVGDSITLAALDPLTLEELSDKEVVCYNLGIKGSAIPLQALMIEKLILPRLNPDIIIWGVKCPSDFKDDPDVVAQEEMNLNSPMARYHTGNLLTTDPELFVNVILLSTFRIYRYRQFLIPPLLGIKTPVDEEIKELEEEYDYRGFDVRTEVFTWGDFGDNGSMYVKEYDDPFMEEWGDLFVDTIKMLDKSDADFLIINHPHRYKDAVYDPTDEIFEDLDSKNFLDLDGLEVFANNTLHRNGGHLNYAGAQIFTELVYNKLKADFL